MAPMNVGELNPRLRQAALANQQGQWRQSEAIARTYLRSSRNDPLALPILGEALLGMRRSVEAENALRDALAIDQVSARARLALSACLELQCRIDEAVEVLDRLLAEQPDSRELWEQLAQVLGRAFRFDRAIETHERKCPAAVTLRGALAIEYSAEILEEECGASS